MPDPATHHSPSTLIRRSARPTDWPRRAPATTATPVRGAITRCWPSPPGTYLRAGTSYVLVWSHLGGTAHRLQQTSSDRQDAGGLVFSIANVFYRGADLDNLSANSGSNALEIAVYGEVNTETVVYIMEPPKPHEIPFIPSVTGGGAILRCFVSPPDTCPSYDDVVSAETILWSATLTAGEQVSGTSVFRVGFNRGNNVAD